MKEFDVQVIGGISHRVQAVSVETYDDFVQFLDEHKYVVFVVPKHALIYAKLIGPWTA